MLRFPYVILDTETTGLDPYIHGITEIAAINSDGLEFSIDVIPFAGCAFSDKAMELTGKSQMEFFMKETNENEVANELKKYLEKCPQSWLFIGANPCFDFTFLYQLSLRTKVKLPINRRKIDVQSIAFGQWAKGYLNLNTHGNVPSLSMDNLLASVNLSRKTSNHGALEDVRLTKLLLERLLK